MDEQRASGIDYASAPLEPPEVSLVVDVADPVMDMNSDYNQMTYKATFEYILVWSDPRLASARVRPRARARADLGRGARGEGRWERALDGTGERPSGVDEQDENHVGGSSPAHAHAYIMQVRSICIILLPNGACGHS